MNVLALDQDPVSAAWAQCDQHVGAMLREAGQVARAAAYRVGAYAPTAWDPRRGAYGGHYSPGGRFATWAASSAEAWRWLRAHGQALADVWLHSRGSRHGAGWWLAWAWLLEPERLFPAVPMPPFARAQTDPAILDPVEAYRDLYRRRMARWASEGREVCWTRRDPPAWLDNPAAGLAA